MFDTKIAIVVDLEGLANQIALVKGPEFVENTYDLCEEIDRIREEYNRDLQQLRKDYMHKFDEAFDKYYKQKPSDDSSEATQ